MDLQVLIPYPSSQLTELQFSFTCSNSVIWKMLLCDLVLNLATLCLYQLICKVIQVYTTTFRSIYSGVFGCHVFGFDLSQFQNVPFVKFTPEFLSCFMHQMQSLLHLFLNMFVLWLFTNWPYETPTTCQEYINVCQSVLKHIDTNSIVLPLIDYPKFFLKSI